MRKALDVFALRKVRCEVSNSVLNIVMEDNGRGFLTETKAHPGDGLRNMRERTTQLGGTFCLESIPGKARKLF